MELILVIAIIALVAMASVPAFNGWFQSYKLGQAVDTLRTRWVKARTLAMDEGRGYRFEWDPEGTTYRMAPDDLDHWPDLAGSPSGPAYSNSTDSPGLVVEESLPDGVHFARYPNDQGASLCFWPDGTARIYGADGTEQADLVILLVDKFNSSRAMQVRSLTGGVTVLDLSNQPNGQ